MWSYLFAFIPLKHRRHGDLTRHIAFAIGAQPVFAWRTSSFVSSIISGHLPHAVRLYREVCQPIRPKPALSAIGRIYFASSESGHWGRFPLVVGLANTQSSGAENRVSFFHSRIECLISSGRLILVRVASIFQSLDSACDETPAKTGHTAAQIEILPFQA